VHAQVITSADVTCWSDLSMKTRPHETMQVLGFHAEMPEGLPVMEIQNLPKA
jgi:hypothetical protein